MSKILRICKSENLPVLADRDSNYVYFVYDKMAIYLGRNYYSDPFCIVETVPEDPVEGMLYITLNGDLKTSLDSTIVDIGSIESEEQKQYLLLAGTVYFMKAESRYLDLQTKTIQLPYQNGSYQLTVSMAKNIMIDENTVIRYDPESGKFVIDGNPYVDDTSGLPGLSDYSGQDTSTIKTVVSNNQISAALKISTRENNMLKVYGNGLYASIKDFVSEDDLNNLIATYANYKAVIDSYMEDLRAELAAAGVNVSEESINKKILSAMEGYEPTIQDLLKYYDSIYQQLGLLRQTVTEYTETYLDDAKKEILDYLHSIETSWSVFPGDGSSEQQSLLSTDELALQGLILEEFRKNLLYLRETEGSHTVGIEYFIVTYDDQFDNVCTIKVLPKLLAVTSDMSSLVGYSYITVSPTIEEGHKYLWKVTDSIPAYNEDLTTRGYTTWDGTSEILVEDGAHVILVEADMNDKALKYGEFITESRLQKPKELEILDVVSAEGSTNGYTELIVNPPIESGNIYMLKKASTIPEFDTIISSDYEEWNGTSELKMDLYDMTMVCLVECTSDYHRARKVGLFPIDLANELLKKLRLKSVAGTKLYYTKISSISPGLSAESSYRIKVTKDKILPKLNSYINNADWLVWNGTDEILCELGDNLIVAEVDVNTKVKKAGVITPVINNTLAVNLTYDEILPDLNHAFIADQTPGSTIYYHAFNPNVEIGLNPLPYGATIDMNDYAILPEDGISVSQYINKISIVEELNGVVYRSCIMNAVIEYVDDLAVTSVAGDNIGGSTLTVSPTLTEGNRYFIETLVMVDGAKYTKNTLIDTSGYTPWDGTSEIDLSQDIGNTSLTIRVLECTTENRVVGCGVVSPVYKTE